MSDDEVQKSGAPRQPSFSIKITRKGMIAAILVDSFPGLDLDDLAPVVDRIYRVVVLPLENKEQG